MLRIEVSKPNNRSFGFVFITNGSGKAYAPSDSSSFYAIEKDVFNVIEPYLYKR